MITKAEPCPTRQGEERRDGVGEKYFIDANDEHSARFEVDTSEIEF